MIEEYDAQRGRSWRQRADAVMQGITMLQRLPVSAQITAYAADTIAVRVEEVLASGDDTWDGQAAEQPFLTARSIQQLFWHGSAGFAGPPSKASPGRGAA